MSHPMSHPSPEELQNRLAGVIRDACGLGYVRSMAIVVDWMPGFPHEPFLLGDANGPLRPFKTEALQSLSDSTFKLWTLLVDMLKEGAESNTRIAEHRLAASGRLLVDITELLAATAARVQHGIQENDPAKAAEELDAYNGQLREACQRFTETYPELAYYAGIGPDAPPARSTQRRSQASLFGGDEDPRPAAQVPQNQGGGLGRPAVD